MLWSWPPTKLGRSWGPPTWVKVTGSPPNQTFFDTAEPSAKKVTNTQKQRHQKRQKKADDRENTLNQMTQLQLAKLTADIMTTSNLITSLMTFLQNTSRN